MQRYIGSKEFPIQYRAVELWNARQRIQTTSVKNIYKKKLKSIMLISGIM